MEGRRFVIQEHTTPEGAHWDLMLEQGQELMTFRLDRPPSQIAAGATKATKIFNHPLRFLTYEGPVQKGTGQVRIVERGTFRLHTQTEDRITLTLTGQSLQAPFLLTQTDGAEWTLTPSAGPENL